MKTILILFCSAFSALTFSQTSLKVLFIGNSYTYVNDLPHLVEELATAEGNQLVHDANTPGGYQLSQHATNATTLSKIASQPWDFVVIQEQSQKPSFPDAQVQADVYPYAKILVDSILSNNACSVPLFYDTWGRENGDPQWTGINTFEKMNNRLFHAYSTMTNDAKGMLSPVGIAYRHIKQDANAVVNFTDLYQGDESHPTIFGSYLGACVFNNLLFSTTSMGNTFLPSGINNAQGEYLQSVADHVVYDVDSVRVDFRPLSNNTFNTAINGTTVDFSPTVQEGNFSAWLFGDGEVANISNTTHTYNQEGTYTVGMVTSNACYSDTLYQTVSVSTLGLSKEEVHNFLVYPNPSTQGRIYIKNPTQKSYHVYSITGDFIYEGKAHSIDLSAGVYVFSIGETHQKIVVL